MDNYFGLRLRPRRGSLRVKIFLSLSIYIFQSIFRESYYLLLLVLFFFFFLGSLLPPLTCFLANMLLAWMRIRTSFLLLSIPLNLKLGLSTYNEYLPHVRAVY